MERINQRARAAHEIGKLKHDAALPIYEPDRERVVFENVRKLNQGPLPDRDLLRIYERIIDIMRQIQKEEIAPRTASAGHCRHGTGIGGKRLDSHRSSVVSFQNLTTEDRRLKTSYDCRHARTRHR